MAKSSNMEVDPEVKTQAHRFRRLLCSALIEYTSILEFIRDDYIENKLTNNRQHAAANYIFTSTELLRLYFLCSQNTFYVYAFSMCS